MARWLRLLSIFLLLTAATGCSYNVPYLGLDVRNVYETSEVSVNYTYVCENSDQRCVYQLYNKLNPSEIIDSGDDVMPQSGKLVFSGLAEGDYRLSFSVYSEKDGEYSLLRFLDGAYVFTVNLP
jgi:hypothetical protein